ncbi:MAG: glycosyltransferase family 1 protein [Candidatus Moranbacteria bacterium]|nr:glycosyltransferase family 1 protein [Candidatus Moranbacteria bacterium]
MRIGIDGSRAFIKQRTGIEEYSYQVIKNLVNKLADHQVTLYVRKKQKIDFDLPKNWRVAIIGCPRLWTQVGLSLEMLFWPVNVLFIPAHTVPLIHPKKTIVTIHGLEYEVMPEAYSAWARFYMRLSIKNSCRWAQKIISVSRNTKQDLISLYKVPEEKIQVIYEGYDRSPVIASEDVNENSHRSAAISTQQSTKQNSDISELKNEIATGAPLPRNDMKPYLLFIGRLEERKNILGIIKSFEILKEKYNIPHKLVLAGNGGFGFAHIELAIGMSKYKDEIIQLGFVKDEDKFELISGAEVFMFPTFYEGFGIPVLEAQSVGVPVVTSNTSSMPEVAGDSAILVDPREPEFIAERTYEVISNKDLRDDIIQKGYENVKRFSWEECAVQIAEVLTEK